MVSLLDSHLARETLKSVGAGLLGAVLPGLRNLSGVDAAVVHAMRDVAVDLSPAILLNALMSALIPAVVTLRRRKRARASAGASLLRLLAGPATVVLGLAAGGTVAALVLIHAAALAFALTGLTATGILAVRAVQAVLLAATLTPLTIVLLSSRSA